MAEHSTQKVIPLEAIPDEGGKTVTIEGEDYLLLNDAFYTFFQRSMGEFSPFFLALRDERKILGCKCTSCGIVRIPPFLTRCPECNFAPTELVEVGDVGKMLATPPITYFANSLFAKQIPYGRGRIVLDGADTAMSINFYTTAGVLVPGAVRKGTEMKVVFRDERRGEITDIFCVPTSELTPEQVAKKGLLESEIRWETATEPEFLRATGDDVARFRSSLDELKAIAEEMKQCERARQDIADWKRNIQAKTKGGQFAIRIHDGDLDFEEGIITHPDFVMACEDPSVLTRGLAYEGSLTQAIMTKQLWISKNAEFTTVFKLERMARSLARSKKV